MIGPPLFGVAGLDLSSTVASKSPLADYTDLLIVIGVGIVLLAVLLVWAKYFRKHRRRRRAHHTPVRKVFAEPAAPTADEEAQDAASRRRYKFRYRRREHRGRNPTLAETGGLPAPLSDQSPPEK